MQQSVRMVTTTRQHHDHCLGNSIHRLRVRMETGETRSKQGPSQSCTMYEYSSLDKPPIQYPWSTQGVRGSFSKLVKAVTINRKTHPSGSPSAPSAPQFRGPVAATLRLCVDYGRFHRGNWFNRLHRKKIVNKDGTWCAESSKRGECHSDVVMRVEVCRGAAGGCVEAGSCGRRRVTDT